MLKRVGRRDQLRQRLIILELKSLYGRKNHEESAKPICRKLGSIERK